MATREQKKKKIYDETASRIADLAFRNELTKAEMDFLLNLLDLVVIKQGNKEILHLIRQWLQSESDPEIDPIIKATLLAVDFNDPDILREKGTVIQELILAKNNGSNQ